jgi:hypothetical protein
MGTAFWGMSMSQPNTGVNFIVGSLLGMIAGLALATTISVPAISAGNGASKWQVWSYNPSNRALRGSISADANAGIATFAFPATPDVALLVTDHGSYKGSLLGDLTGRTVSARVSAAGGSFNYYGQGTPQNPCGTPANVRLFFQTKSSGSFAETDYWWSNPVLLPLASIPSVTPMSAPLTGANWFGLQRTLRQRPAVRGGLCRRGEERHLDRPVLRRRMFFRERGRRTERRFVHAVELCGQLVGD